MRNSEIINKFYAVNEVTPELLISKGWKSFFPYEETVEMERLNYLRFLNFKKEIKGEIRSIEFFGREVRYYYNIENRSTFFLLNVGIYESSL